MGCPASTVLTETDSARYAALPNSVYETSEEQWCALSPGHDGEHAAEVQSAVFSDRSYWMFWNDGEPGYRILLLPNCPVTCRRADHTTALCLLYAGHGGAHDWIDQKG
ncbi:hypothetical protein [Streptomyces violaceusniger]|uniref:Uncharacterized protein n=1 Tax=Streptomyces violaceusniger (strain Tu 4113) TaxID=653045 RepID=G2PHV3_STRV4|nr:hypothetical protein [Streptomyces violaceusniger]AEM88904.1 hypothetical protein Strvi_0128 [Streptomyces violaceusniger Tu 4113]